MPSTMSGRMMYIYLVFVSGMMKQIYLFMTATGSRINAQIANPSCGLFLTNRGKLNSQKLHKVCPLGTEVTNTGYRLLTLVTQEPTWAAECTRRRHECSTILVPWFQSSDITSPIFSHKCHRCLYHSPLGNSLVQLPQFPVQHYLRTILNHI